MSVKNVKKLYKQIYVAKGPTKEDPDIGANHINSR
jgi:hypothetical protein